MIGTAVRLVPRPATVVAWVDQDGKPTWTKRTTWVVIEFPDGARTTVLPEHLEVVR
jgi:hypothetical protein